MAENNVETVDADAEPQELEVDMENQADHIRTVFSDPKNFNVKVRAYQTFKPYDVPMILSTAPFIFAMDALV